MKTKIAVATSHLESLDNQKIRQSQIRETAGHLKNFPRAVFCGDFNFDATKTYGDWNRAKKNLSPFKSFENLENHVLNQELGHLNFVDTWDFLKTSAGAEPLDLGLTFDGFTNPGLVQDRDERMRYDRIMATGLEPIKIDVIGKETLTFDQDPTGTDLNVKISDHYGVVAEFEL